MYDKGVLSDDGFRQARSAATADAPSATFATAATFGHIGPQVALYLQKLRKGPDAAGGKRRSKRDERAAVRRFRTPAGS